MYFKILNIYIMKGNKWNEFEKIYKNILLALNLFFYFFHIFFVYFISFTFSRKKILWIKHSLDIIIIIFGIFLPLLGFRKTVKKMLRKIIFLYLNLLWKIRKKVIKN